MSQASSPRESIQLVNPGRRRFLISSTVLGGALLVGCSPAPPDRLGSGKEITEGRNENALNAWLKISTDNIVTVAVARAEMGQGVSTALPMLVAEELGCAWADVRFELISPQSVHGNIKSITESLPFRNDDTGAMARLARWLAPQLAGNGQLVTGGSTSVRDAWEPLRMAGAAARYALVAAASRQLDIPIEDLIVSAGHVVTHDGKRLSFGELADAAGDVPLPPNLRLKAPVDYQFLGKPLPRLDIPDKVDGSAKFGADIRLPNMLYAAVSMCPVAGGTIVSVDDKAALAMHDVVKIVRSPAIMGASPSVVVVAKDFWTASKALELVKIVWNEGTLASYGSEASLNQMIEALNTEKGSLWYADGNLATVERSGARRIDAVYTVPLLAHAALEPATCTALYDTSGKVVRMKIWAPTQTPAAYAQAAAKAADVIEDNITIQPTLIGGGFGYKSLIEPLLQAVMAAKALPDTPVQVLWTRAQDLQHDHYRPAAAAHSSAWLRGEGQTGQWAGWRFRSASASVIDAFLASMAPPWLANRIPDKTTVEGAFDNRYKVDAQEIYHIKLPTTAPIGFWRSVGHSHQAFFVESFVDEVAHALKRDPLKHRLRLLVNTPRYARVLQAAADKAKWTKSHGPNTALGLALHESFGSICAQVVELQRNETGAIRIERVTCAIDCGRAIHPDIIAQQVEGAVIFGLTAALYGRITMKAGRVEQANFPDYPLLNLDHSPIIDTVIMPSDEAPGGVGEVGTPPIAPALCNAIFSLTGKRIRDLPIADQVPLF